MVPLDMTSFLLRKGNLDEQQFGFFNGLQVLDGNSLSEYNITQSALIKAKLHAHRLSDSQYYNSSID